VLQKRFPPCRANPLHLIQPGCQAGPPALALVLLKRKAMGLIPDALHQV